MFANLHLYRLALPWEMTVEQLQSQLEKRSFQPCGSQDQKMMGWISPRENSSDLVYALGQQWLLALKIETKSVPKSEIKKIVAEKAKVYEEQNGYKPARKVLKELSEEALMDLLPRAFPKQFTIQIWINHEDGWVAMNTSAPAKADDVVSALLEAFSDMPISLVRTNVSPSQSMADWLISGDGPENFTIDRECELKGVDDDKPVVKYSRLSLERDEIRQHIEEGKLPTKLAMTWNDRISFLLTDKLQIKRVNFLDVVMEENNLDQDDAEEIFKATFMIMTKELSRFFPHLTESLGGEACNDG